MVPYGHYYLNNRSAVAVQRLGSTIITPTGAAISVAPQCLALP